MEDSDIKNIEEDINQIFKCSCSREKVEKTLKLLGKEEITSILEEDGKAEIECRFCNKKYNFTKEDLKAILESLE